MDQKEIQEKGALAKMFLEDAKKMRAKADQLYAKAQEATHTAAVIVRALEDEQSGLDLKIRVVNASALVEINQAVAIARRLMPSAFRPSFRVVKGGAA